MSKFTKQKTPQFGLCLDWETSGSAWGDDSSKEYQGISFGAIIFDTSNFQPIKKLYQVIKFDETRYKWSEEAEKVHGLSREFLEKNGVSQEEAAINLLELLSEFFAGSKVMFLGHNCEFDIRFTKQLLDIVEVEFSLENSGKYDTHIHLHHVVLNTSQLGFITLGLYKSDLLFDAMGFEKREEHNALNDAEMTLQTCANIRFLMETALNG